MLVYEKSASFDTKITSIPFFSRLDHFLAFNNHTTSESSLRYLKPQAGYRWLLGMQWKGSVYMDKVLPFGLRSAPKIYNAIADAQM